MRRLVFAITILFVGYAQAQQPRPPLLQHENPKPRPALLGADSPKPRAPLLSGQPVIERVLLNKNSVVKHVSFTKDRTGNGLLTWVVLEHEGGKKTPLVFAGTDARIQVGVSIDRLRVYEGANVYEELRINGDASRPVSVKK